METTIVENQMEKKMENEMEIGIIMGYTRVVKGSYKAYRSSSPDLKASRHSLYDMQRGTLTSSLSCLHTLTARLRVTW